MAIDESTQVERQTVMHTEGGATPSYRGKPSYDGYQQTSDSEKMFQREAQPYDQRYFRPRVEDANKNGRTRARQVNRIETKILGAGECDINHRPVFYVGPEDGGPVNGTQGYTVDVCVGARRFLIDDNGIFVTCGNKTWDVCDVFEQLEAAGVIV